MTDLLTADPTSLEALALRARGGCIVFTDHPLPEGCSPARADIGLECDAGRLLLHVRLGTVYDGPDEEVARWVRDGTRSFDDLADGIAWLRERMHSQPGCAEDGPATDELTDLARVDIDRGPRITAESIESSLRREILGQDEPIRGLSEHVATHLAKPHPRRPASALLIGPTGCGKTLAAEALAEQLRTMTREPWGYHRLDMSEFSEAHAAARLFGSPPGYVGYQDDMNLAAALRGNPRSVVLFDEIDKAHPQIWHSLMNLMDAGRLNDEGGELDARGAILLFTSNRNAIGIQALSEASDPQLRAFLRERGYPAEIVARIGRVLPFSPLTPAIQVDLLLLTVQRVMESFGLRLAHIEAEALSRLLRDAPLESGGRDVEYFVERALARQITERSFTSTNVIVRDGEPLRVLSAD